jgi:hypothetical protein
MHCFLVPANQEKEEKLKKILFTIGMAFAIGKAGTIEIPGDPNAPISNFQNPGSSATVGYSITASDDGTNFLVHLVTADPTALAFSNLYFDTIAMKPNTGSNLGFEFLLPEPVLLRSTSRYRTRSL